MSATVVPVDVARQLRAICGDENVIDDPDQLALQATNGVTPSVAIWPGSAEEIAAVLRIANHFGLPIAPAGGRTHQYLGQREEPRGLLHTTRLTDVEHYDHADLTVGVGAGMAVTQLNEMVRADNLMFAADPPLPEQSTVGGLLATASHGPLRHGYGSVRDFCIGIRFVTGDGRRAKGGGRVVKNVAGYDLMKLLIGSYGSLAVITSASFKLFPAPRQTTTFLAEFATATEALKFSDLVIRSPLSPMCLELVSPVARKLMRPGMATDSWVMCLRAAGSDAVLGRYRTELGSAATREVVGEEESKLWTAIQNFPFTPGAEDQNNWDSGFHHRIDIFVPTRDVLRVIETLNEEAATGYTGVAMIGRVAVGHVLAVTWPTHKEAQWPNGAVVHKLKSSLGSAVSVKAELLANPWPIEPPHLASMRAVKQALDPNSVLRGRELF